MFEYRIEDSLVPITKGKEGLRGFGFELAFNEFYDLYASGKVWNKQSCAWRTSRCICVGANTGGESWRERLSKDAGGTLTVARDEAAGRL